MPDAETMTSLLQSVFPPAASLGVRIVDATPERAVAEIPLLGNTNHLGSMYAGSLFTVAELVLGGWGMAALDLARYSGVVTTSSIDYHLEAVTDVRAKVTCDQDILSAAKQLADRHGRADLTLQVELTDTSGELVATARTAIQLRADTGCVAGVSER